MRRRHFAFAVLAATLVPASAALSDWAPISRTELLSATPDVLLVRVTGMTNEMRSLASIAHPVPMRRVEAMVLERYRGERQPGRSIEFFVPGGVTPDGRVVSFSTSPAIEEFAGREAVVFLSTGGALAPEGGLGLPDGAHGIYRVEATKKGERIVRGRTGSPLPRDLSLAALADEARAIEAAARAAERRER